MSARIKKVLILEDDCDLAASYQMILGLMLPHQLHVLHDMKEMLASSADALACDVALIDVDLGHNQPTGLDAYQWLRENGFKGSIFFVTGHARTHPAVVEAVELNGVSLLQKPVELDRLIEAINSGKTNVAVHS